jgi:hypothetical protein
MKIIQCLDLKKWFLNINYIKVLNFKTLGQTFEIICIEFN